MQAKMWASRLIEELEVQNLKDKKIECRKCGQSEGKHGSVSEVGVGLHSESMNREQRQ